MAAPEGFLGETSFHGQLDELIVRQVAVEAVVVQLHVGLADVQYSHHVGGDARDLEDKYGVTEHYRMHRTFRMKETTNVYNLRAYTYVYILNGNEHVLPCLLHNLFEFYLGQWYGMA